VITPDEKLCPLEIRPQVSHRPDDAERLNFGGEVVVLRGEKSTTIDADGVVFPIGLLVLKQTIQMFIASVYIYDAAPVSP